MSVVAQRFEPMITLEQIMTQVKQLSLDQRLRLIQFTAQTLMVPSPKNTSQPLPYGKFSGGQQSTLEDFALAEWHPTEKELNGE
jgi:hypothetical protein